MLGQTLHSDRMIHVTVSLATIRLLKLYFEVNNNDVNNYQLIH